MPVPVPTDAPIFPPLVRADVDAARTSSWLDTFEDLTFPTTVISIDDLGERDDFLAWMKSDSIFLPGAPASEDAPTYHLPKLTEAINAAIEKYGAVFPKLNWTAPRDAAFLLPQGNGPLHSTSAADIFLLLKSSDFAHHGLSSSTAYEGCSDSGPEPKLELVLKKYEEINPAQEVRCFVRDQCLLGISQRDTNYYEHLKDGGMKEKVIEFFEEEVRENYGPRDYTFDLHVGEKIQIVDFGPFRESTDPLLFSYEELRDILVAQSGPEFRVIDHPSHPAANRGVPTFGTNMLPVEMVEMSEGRTQEEFRAAWNEAVEAGFVDAGEEMPRMQ